MIVGTSFPGDDDDKAKSLQHDCYGLALDIIARGCMRNLRNAHLLASETVPEYLEPANIDKGFDHRTLQVAHDHLAACWRARTRHFAPTLGLEDDHDQKLTSEWLGWLGEEVAEWQQSNHALLRLVVLAVSAQNTDVGYSAEDALITCLRECYPLPTTHWHAE